MRNQPSLFDGIRLSLDDSIALSISSLNEYGRRYKHWCVAYSGGKDSTATLTFVAWCILNGKVERPVSLTVLYADTRMELPPLIHGALSLMSQLRSQGINAQVVLPKLEDRFFVYMFGRGVPPPKNRFRWCTPQLKVEPMHNALHGLREDSGEKLLMLTGVRLGESSARDARIALSCSKDSGECGQGWFQVATPASTADTLSPLLHWRLCHIYDWLYFEQGRHGYETSSIAEVYGDEDIRTGCIECNLASVDVALDRLLLSPRWAHLSPLKELKPLYAELTMAKWRKRKSNPEMRKDGQWSINAQRLGPLTMDARLYGLNKVKSIQERANVDLINAEEESKIMELISANTWPNKWDGTEINGDELIDSIHVVGNTIVTQNRLFVN